jgi:hypothetical protein
MPVLSDFIGAGWQSGILLLEKSKLSWAVMS